MVRLKIFSIATVWLSLLNSFFYHGVHGRTATLLTPRGFCILGVSPVVTFAFDNATQLYRLDTSANETGDERALKQNMRNSAASISTVDFLSDDEDEENVVYTSTEAFGVERDSAIALTPAQISLFATNRQESRGTLRRVAGNASLPESLEMRLCPCGWRYNRSQTSTSHRQRVDYYCPADANFCSGRWSARPTCIYEDSTDTYIKTIWLPLLLALSCLMLCLVCTNPGNDAAGGCVTVLCRCTPLNKLYLRWAVNRMLTLNPRSAYTLIRAALRRERGLQPARTSRRRSQPAQESQEALDSTSSRKVALKTRKYCEEEKAGKAEENDDGLLDACAICFLDLEDEERVGVLENCAHLFHVDCLKVWLAKRNVCPLCLNTAAKPLEESDKAETAQIQDETAPAQQE